MKKLLILAFRLSCGLIFTGSCKKDNPVPSSTVVGYWKGKIGHSQQYPTHGYAYLYRNDGTVRVYFLGNNPDTFNVKIAEGTYSITGNQVSTTHKYFFNGPQHSSFATINAGFTFKEGTWGHNLNPSDGGKFFLHKIQ